MPTYQYRCTECDDSLEVIQKFADDPLTVCPSCTGRLRKVFSPVGVVFKGSGFYKTDSRAGKRSEGQRADAKVGDAAGKASESATPAADTTGGPVADGGKASDGSTSEGSKPNGSTSEGSGASPTERSTADGPASSNRTGPARGSSRKEPVHKVA